MPWAMKENVIKFPIQQILQRHEDYMNTLSHSPISERGHSGIAILAQAASVKCASEMYQLSNEDQRSSPGSPFSSGGRGAIPGCF